MKIDFLCQKSNKTKKNSIHNSHNNLFATRKIYLIAIISALIPKNIGRMSDSECG